MHCQNGHVRNFAKHGRVGRYSVSRETLHGALTETRLLSANTSRPQGRKAAPHRMAMVGAGHGDFGDPSVGLANIGSFSGSTTLKSMPWSAASYGRPLPHASAPSDHTHRDGPAISPHRRPSPRRATAPGSSILPAATGVTCRCRECHLTTQRPRERMCIDFTRMPS